MGAWGAGPFENDDAHDLLGELSELPADELSGRLEAALAIPADGYLEVDEANAAIAAAGLIAVARGAALDGVDEVVMELANTDPVQNSARLRAPALAALARVTGESSEWQALWSESETSAAQADAMIEGLRSALA
ncbi:MAG: DUF4259 domain-containing protein [Nocardiopsaceae bacterium]|jgi:hypothetical protein|nr:DUF4259 domain-containing protein [Nocardiopsaceae bacterium]